MKQTCQTKYPLIRPSRSRSPEVKGRPQSAESTMSSSFYNLTSRRNTRVLINVYHPRRLYTPRLARLPPGDTEAFPPRLTPTTAEDNKASLEKEVKQLKQQVKELKEKLALAETQRDKYEEQLKQFSRQTKPVHLLRTIWKQILASELDPQRPKTSFLKLLANKSKSEAEIALRNLGIPRRGVQTFFTRFYEDDRLNDHKLLSFLKSRPSQPFYEDVENSIRLMTRSLALRNVSKLDLEVAFRSKLPEDCMQQQAVEVVTDTYAIAESVVKAVVNFLWKGKATASVSRIDWGQIPAWSTFNNVVERVRLHLALAGRHLSDVPMLISFPLTVANLEKAAKSYFGLESEEEITLLSASLFPDRAIKPRTTVSELLSPDWCTATELEVEKRLAEIAELLPIRLLSVVAERTTPLSATAISLSDFLLHCEKAASRALSAKQKAALTLHCYKETHTLDALCFTSFRDKMCGLAFASPGEMQPERPVDS